VATITITKTSCTKAAPQAAAYTLWDDRLPGFGLRVMPSGAKSFVLKYRDADSGRQHWHTLGRFGVDMTAEQARDEAGKLKPAIKHEKANPVQDRRDRIDADTVAELADAYLAERPTMKRRGKERPKKESSWKQDASNISAHIKPQLGGHSIRGLKQSDIERFRDAVAKGKTAREVTVAKDQPGYKPRSRVIVRGGAGTANRSLAVLSAMLSWAVKRNAIPANPALGVSPLETAAIRRDFRGDELEALAKALTDWQADAYAMPVEAVGRYPLSARQLAARAKAREARIVARRKWVRAITLLLLSGARKNEILQLRWADYDATARCLRLPDSKTGAKVVPLGKHALELVETARADAGGSEWVFPSVKGDTPLTGLQKVWEGICERGGLTGVTIHSMRHTFASVAVNDGASLFIAGKLLGHSDTRTTEGYSHANMGRAHEVADQTSATLAGRFRVIEGGKAAAG
jgi:integrase